LVVLQEALTLKCPHCQKAFFDFSGCCAVTCECNKHFCGLCAVACTDGGACHDHVRGCELNKNRGEYFCSEEQIKAAHRLIRIRKLKPLVKTIPADVKEEVLELFEKDLLDFGIYVFDIR
jgi:hypothetical protein